MQKLPLRPLRQIRLNRIETNSITPAEPSENGEKERGQGINSCDKETLIIQEKTMSVEITKTQPLRGDAEAQKLLRRTPNNYLYNQVYGLSLYASLFILTLIITHGVTTSNYGTFARIQTTINTIIYIVAFGLEDTIATFVPRIFAEYGKASAASLIRRVLSLRLGILLFGLLFFIFGLPALALLITLIPIQGSAQLAHGLQDPILLAHIWPIILYVIGTGITNVLMAVCAAVMRMKVVLAIGGVIQLGLLTTGFAAVHLGFGIDGVLWMQAIISLFGATAFAFWLAPLIFSRGAEYRQPLKPIIKLGFSAWMNNLVSGALLKQVAILLLVYFTASMANTSVAYFNLSFQMADAANVLLVAGFSGVGAAALAAAFVGDNQERLARSWQALIKIETLIAAPGLIFCLFNAQNIAHALYGSKYDAVGPLLAIFLAFNIFVRIIGTTIHQSSLYVIGKAGLVVVSQWAALLTIIGVGMLLVPSLGPAGALIADGAAKVVTGGLMLIFLLPTLPRKYPLELLSFTLRFLLALVAAALPSLLWHPADRIQLGLSGGLFLILCLLLLRVIKPLTKEDIALIGMMKPKMVPYLRWFVRS